MRLGDQPPSLLYHDAGGGTTWVLTYVRSCFWQRDVFDVFPYYNAAKGSLLFVLCSVEGEGGDV